MSTKRRAIGRTVRAKEAWEILGGQGVVRDFEKDGQLKPCCENKPRTAVGRRIVFYARADIDRCEAELLANRYPGKASERRPA